MKNKGFTLVELLAVIVILAIIALIATPIVLNIIQDTRESATIRSGEFYISAAEQAIMRYNMNNPGEYFNPTKCIVTSGNLDCPGVDDIIDVDIDGEKPKDGSIIEFKNGKVTDGTTLTFENGKVTLTNGEVVFENINNSTVVECTIERKTEGKITVGDKVTCGDESFNVLSSSYNSVTMLSSSLIGTSSFSNNNFWTQLNISTYENNNIESVNINDYLGQTNLNLALTTYKTNLQNLLGEKTIDVRLLSLTDLFQLNCKEEEYGLPPYSVVCGNTKNWITAQSNYWLGSVNGNGVYVMAPGYDSRPDNDGYEYINVALTKGYTTTAGIRPVVTIPREVIK